MENNSQAPQASTAAPEISDNNTDNISDSGTETKAEQQAQALKKKYKYKVDGNEVEEEIDFSDEENIKQKLSLAKAAQKRMQESAKVKKEAEQFIKALKENPLEILQDERLMGSAKFREVAEAFLAKQLQQEMLTPEQRRQMEIENELNKYKQQEAKAKEKTEQEQMAKLQQHYQQELQSTIVEALQSVNLPKTKKTIASMASLISKSMQHGLDLDAKTLGKMVRQQYEQDLREMFESSSEDSLLSILGDSVTNKIRKADLKRLKNATGFQQKVEKPKSNYNEQQPSRALTKEEWRAEIDKRIKSK